MRVLGLIPAVVLLTAAGCVVPQEPGPTPTAPSLPSQFTRSIIVRPDWEGMGVPGNHIFKMGRSDTLVLKFTVTVQCDDCRMIGRIAFIPVDSFFDEDRDVGAGVSVTGGVDLDARDGDVHKGDATVRTKDTPKGTMFSVGADGGPLDGNMTVHSIQVEVEDPHIPIPPLAGARSPGPVRTARA